jgi:hypothetical protein
MLPRVLAILVAAAAFLGGERPGQADPLWEATLVLDPWTNASGPILTGRHWAMPASEIIDPWEHAGEPGERRDELEIVDPWESLRPRIPTASFPPYAGN